MGIINEWRRGIRVKMLVVAVSTTLVMGVLSTTAYFGMTKLGKMLDDSYRVMIPTFDSITGMLIARNAMAYYTLQAIVRADKPEDRKSSIEKLSIALQDYKNDQKYFESTEFEPEEEVTYKPVKEHKAQFYEATEKIIADLKLGTAEADGRALIQIEEQGDWQKYAREARVALEKNIKLYQDMAVKNNEIQNDIRKKYLDLLLGVSVVAGFALLVFILTISHKIAKGVGDVVSNLNSVSSQLTGAIEQLSAGGQSLSQNTTESAASLEETVASLEELTSMVNLNTDNARQAATLSNESSSIATEGSEKIKSLITSMDDISRSSKKIEEIINVIDDIAFQTNLLALNAAVEAARAGEQGKGFAVVAEAVRSLAQRSAVAAKDISGMIKDNVDKTVSGSRTASSSSEVFESIVSSVKKVSSLNGEIATASSEQADGIKQISTAMNQLDQSAQSNAGSSEEIAATADELTSQAIQMQKIVEGLADLVLGSDGHTANQEPTGRPAPHRSKAA